MFEWLAQHRDVLVVFINLVTLAIWLVYAQLLYWGFRRQRRPRLLINRGKKRDIDALCIISNMSAESIFLEYIVADLETSRGTITVDVTDREQQYSEGDETRGDTTTHDGSPPERRHDPSAGRHDTRQGPLDSGDFLHIGTFSGLIHSIAELEGIEMAGHRPADDLVLHSLTIRLIGIYGPEDMPVGAERRFRLEDRGDQCALTPASWDTKRLASWRQRRRLRRLIQRLSAQRTDRLIGLSDHAR
ncbi:hypothetical protein CVH10_14405 [Halomonas sp. ND22Bw]|uniref:hypothetical protein n=1 Tax=Halomonas sp. ND22Bw TaxID=2054178 RepID=UPI000D0B2D4E|nr:hypothetical protein CVH10_14405 [Halomonas sp. ND22Bw]